MPSCDIFCRVIDNFGDAGIAWRLAQSLSRELHWKTRLIIDRPDVLAAMVPQVDSSRSVQEAAGVTVTEWNKTFYAAPGICADVVIEAFSCYLPSRYEAAINEACCSQRHIAVFALDYLTAEEYAEHSHGLTSPHPRYGYPKTFVFPGFTEKTGGIVYEAGLRAALDRFTAKDREVFLQQLGADPRHPFTLLYFTYPTTAADQIVRALVDDARPAQILAAPGEASEQLARAIDKEGAANLIRIVRIPFVPQNEFDRLAMSADAALVRGEDSTMRVQLAAVPLLWTLYPQSEMTHLTKLEAFSSLYCKSLPQQAGRVWSALEEALNGKTPVTPALWTAWRDALHEMKVGARAWRDYLFSQQSLTERLAALVSTRTDQA